MSHNPSVTEPLSYPGGKNGLIRPTCSCGWVGNGLYSTAVRALKDAEAHAEAKNKALEDAREDLREEAEWQEELTASGYYD